MDFSAFSDGQIRSKLWLCEELEPYLQAQSKIAILGSWYNITGLLLNVRKNNFYQCIDGYDYDSTVKEIADKINTTWNCYPNKTLNNFTVDVNTVDLTMYDCVISTSVEHMDNHNWFFKLKENTLVCIQSSNMNTTDPIWDIKSPSKSIEHLTDKFPFSQTLYQGEKVFDYGHLKYSRYMIIGKI